MDKLIEMVLEYLKNEYPNLIVLMAVIVLAIFGSTKAWEFFRKLKRERLELKKLKTEIGEGESLIQKASLDDVKRYDDKTRRIIQIGDTAKSKYLKRWSLFDVFPVFAFLLFISLLLLLLFFLGKLECH